MKTKHILLIVLLVAIIILPHDFIYAQCAMCKQNAEGAGKNSAQGINYGIMYLLLIPYALIGALGYWWYVKNKKNKQPQ